MSRLIAVAVPVPFLDLLTYRVPDRIGVPVRGARVLVPLGSRVITGIVVGVEEPADPGLSGVKDVIDVLDDGPFVPEANIDLALWVAEYYVCGPGEALMISMPPGAAVQSERRIRLTDRGEAARRSQVGVRDGLKARILGLLQGDRAQAVSALAARLGKARAPGTRPPPLHAIVRELQREDLVELSQPLRGRADARRTIRVAAITAEGLDLDLKVGRRQREVLDALGETSGGLPLRQLKERGISSEIVTRLARRGLVTLRREPVARDPFATELQGPGRLHKIGRVLTSEQTAAVDELGVAALSGGFSVALLQGVTGSGKTEIYLRLADLVGRTGRSVLVLVPEIALTPAVAAAFRAAFGDHVAIQHSGLSDGERYDQWMRIRHGDVSIVVGTRSAVFAPLASLGLIIVDEEHDGSFKQDEAPRYHGRDVAVMRGKQAGALVVLGSATPALESAYNARSGRYTRVTLAHRVLGRPLAIVRIVDMREEYAAHGPDVILSEPLKAALSDRLARGEQSLVLLNRRGLATAVFCRQCAAALDCPNCSVSLIVHREGAGALRARCHYCNFAMRVPATCPLCAGPYMERIGFGTQRVEAEIRATWPEARVTRLDRDSVRRRGAVAALLADVAQGRIDVLVGTQMIAKGHDFPGVTLVGVISADVGLGLADFRAAERTFQLLTQVAGRAGRGTRRGEAIVQTLYPGHYSIEHARRQDYDAFFEDEIKYRRAMRYPPLVSLVNLVVRAPSARQAMADAETLAQALRRDGEAGQYRVLGPAPAPLGKLRGEFRAQVFLKGTHRAAMREAVRAALASQPELRSRAIVDVDPLSVL